MKLEHLGKFYAIAISLMGGLVGVFCAVHYFRAVAISGNAVYELGLFFALYILSCVCCCVPMHLRREVCLDLSFLSGFAALLSCGPETAAAIAFLTTPFVFSRGSASERGLKHIFNTPFSITAFNAAGRVLPVYIAGLAFQWAGGEVGQFDLRSTVGPALLLMLCYMLLGAVINTQLLALRDGRSIFAGLKLRLPRYLQSVLLAIPLGFFFARSLLTEYGFYNAAFFILVLQMARLCSEVFVKIRNNYYIMMKTMTNTLEAKDEYTRGHSERVEIYSRIIASEMHLPQSRIEELSVAALLHDVGKIGIDENILKKPDRLNSDERRIIQTHPEISLQILKDVRLSPLALNIIEHHHERYDGAGYPSGLGGDELPMEVYAIGVADTYDAITSDRPYSSGRTPSTAREIIVEESGSQFHPEAVKAFLRAYDKGKLTIGRKKPVAEPLTITAEIRQQIQGVG